MQQANKFGIKNIMPSPATARPPSADTWRRGRAPRDKRGGHSPDGQSAACRGQTALASAAIIAETTIGSRHRGPVWQFAAARARRLEPMDAPRTRRWCGPQIRTLTFPRTQRLIAVLELL